MPTEAEKDPRGADTEWDACPILSTGNDFPESLVRVILGPKTAVHLLDTFRLMLSTCKGQLQYLTMPSNVDKLFIVALFGFV
jgi:hypothetical protein